MSTATASLTESSRLVPMYMGMARQLLAEIARRRLRQGDRLGTEAELCERYAVSRQTVRQALAVLMEQGYVLPRRRLGTFVERSVEPAVARRVCTGTVVFACSANEFIEGSENFAVSRILANVESELAEAGLSTQLMVLGRDAEADRARLAAAAQSNQISAVLALGDLSDELTGLPAHVPRVYCSAAFDGRLPWLGGDLRRIGHMVAQHLLRLGHRRIALLCGADMTREWFGRMARGFREAFDEAGATWERKLVYQADADESLSDVAREFLSGSERPTAIFAANWLVCRAVLSVSAELGLRAPDDYSLASFGLNVLHHVNRDVTTWVPDYTRNGRLLGQMLRSLVAGESAPMEPVVTMPNLHEGVTTRRLEN